MSLNYDKLPLHMREGARLYVESGIEPGGFMYAVLCNNLMDAFLRADEINAERMRSWADWLLSNCPSGAWGSAEKVDAWILHRGLEGIER